MKNQFKVIKSPSPLSPQGAASKLYVDSEFNSPSISNSTTHKDFKDEKLNNVRFINLNS